MQATTVKKNKPQAIFNTWTMVQGCITLTLADGQLRIR